MEPNENRPAQPVNPRRRPRSKFQTFKEAYLPAIIAGVALVLILVFIIGSISLKVQQRKAEAAASLAASVSQAEEDAMLAQKAQELLAAAQKLAASYDYDGAIGILQSFPGDIAKYEDLNNQLISYEQAKSKLVEWNDPSQITNLSIQLLIADPPRAYNHSVYADSFNRNFITTAEFSSILQQLYDNGYILVSLDDFITTETTETGETVYRSKSLYLPNGKKPLMLTQTNVNYNIYLLDSDGDTLPDQGGGGFASKMVLDENGKITCEMVDASGQTVTGAFDMVPILDAFVEAHPDFSYRGAKALLALTGYNGLFGYRTHNAAREQFGEDAYNAAVQGAMQIANVLRDTGYDLACYTYENISYGDSSVTEIQSDLQGWTNEVVPIIGQTDILVYAQMRDITTEETYSGEKYDALYALGFRHFIGFGQDGAPWISITDSYVRQGRILISGASLANNGAWFTNFFDASLVLDKNRPEIAQ